MKTSEPEIRRPMTMAALAQVAGLTLGWALPLPGAALGALALAIAATTAWRTHRARRIHGPEPGMGVGLIFIVLCLGWHQGGEIDRADSAARRSAELWFTGRIVELTGRIAEPPRERLHCVDCVVERAAVRDFLEAGPCVALAGRVRVRLDCEWAAGRDPGWLLPGQAVRVWGRLDPVVRQTSPSIFDAAQYARGRDLCAAMFVKRSGDMELGPEPGGPLAVFRRAMARVRASMAAQLARRLEGDRLELARTLILGEYWRFPSERRDAFVNTGLAHLLAVSGLHTGFVLLTILALARLVGFSPRGAAWLGVIGLVCFAALTGFRPSIVRAAIMGAALLTGFALGRSANLVGALAVAAFVTLLFDPRSLWRMDWRLSYACVLSVILLAAPIRAMLVPPREPGESDPMRPDARKTLWFHLLDSLVISTLAASAAIWFGLGPVQLALFREFNLLYPLANILAIPLTFLALTFSMATSLLGAIPGLGAALGAAAGALLDALMNVAELFGTFDWARVTMAPLPLIAVAFYYVILLTGRWPRRGEGTGRNFALRLLGLIAIVVWAAVLRPAPCGALDLYFLDVGQGDSIVCRFPNGRIMVIDAGKPACGARVVAPFLETLGVRKIDCLIATHGDQDHVGGMPHLIEHFGVRAFYAGSDPGRGAFDPVLAALEKSSALRFELHPGQTLDGFGGAEIRALGSLPGTTGNDASVGLWIRYGETECLLTGDLEMPGETELLAMGLLGDVEVLKAGHHGSKSSSSTAFLGAVRPELAVISVGERNAYGHPAPEVLERLGDAGAQILRTDQMGALWIHTDGHLIQAWRYGGP